MASWFSTLFGYENIEESQLRNNADSVKLGILADHTPNLLDTNDNKGKVKALIQKGSLEGVILRGPAPIVRPYANPNQKDKRTSEQVLKDALQLPAPPVSAVGPARNAPDQNIFKRGLGSGESHIYCVTKNDLSEIISKLRKTTVRAPKTHMSEFPKDSLLTEFMKKAKYMQEQRQKHTDEYKTLTIDSNPDSGSVQDSDIDLEDKTWTIDSNTEWNFEFDLEEEQSEEEKGNSTDGEDKSMETAEDDGEQSLSFFVAEELKEWENEIVVI